MSSETTRKATVLVIDDEPANLGVLFDYLKVSGFQILIAEDGEEGLSHAELALPDIILLDIMMPGMDGFETCRRLRQNEKTGDIPVIFVTALSDTFDKVKGFEVGGVDYVTKPFQQEEVLSRVRTHLTLRRQRKELAEMNAAKNKFFSILAHDLKSPFNGLLGGFRYLLDYFDQLDGKQIKGFLRDMNAATRQTFALLENLLAWSRSQAGHMRRHPRNLDMCQMVSNNLRLMRRNAEEKDIRLSNEIRKNTLAYADSDMIIAVVRNLLSNAIKYTHPGGEIVFASEDKGELVEISVSDDGVGMKEEHLANLFRIDAPSYSVPGTANENGTGLGLILCKEFVEKNGGTIRAQSEWGKGSAFRFTLPKGNEKWEVRSEK